MHQLSRNTLCMSGFSTWSSHATLLTQHSLSHSKRWACPWRWQSRHPSFRNVCTVNVSTGMARHCRITNSKLADTIKKLNRKVPNPSQQITHWAMLQKHINSEKLVTGMRMSTGGRTASCARRSGKGQVRHRSFKRNWIQLGTLGFQTRTKCCDKTLNVLW